MYTVRYDRKLDKPSGHTLCVGTGTVRVPALRGSLALHAAATSRANESGFQKNREGLADFGSDPSSFAWPAHRDEPQRVIRVLDIAVLVAYFVAGVVAQRGQGSACEGTSLWADVRPLASCRRPRAALKCSCRSDRVARD